MPSPDEIDGYQAAIHHTWAKGRRRRNSFVPMLGGDERDEGAPDDASPEFMIGWRAGIDSATW